MEIPSIELSERTLTDICTIIDEQRQQIDGEEPRVTYTVKEKTRDFVTHNSEDFIKHAITRELGRIEIWYYHSKRKIRIDLVVKSYGHSDFTVEADNRIWVDGITRRLEGVFRSYKTNNDLFHSRWKSAIPIYIGLGVLLGVTILLVGSSFIPIISEDGEDNTLAAWTFIGGFVGAWSILGWNGLFEWLFPEVETEYTPQKKYRKRLLTVISTVLGTISLGLFVNYLFAILQN